MRRLIIIILGVITIMNISGSNNIKIEVDNNLHMYFAPELINYKNVVSICYDDFKEAYICGVDTVTIFSPEAFVFDTGMDAITYWIEKNQYVFISSHTQSSEVSVMACAPTITVLNTVVQAFDETKGYYDYGNVISYYNGDYACNQSGGKTFLFGGIIRQKESGICAAEIGDSSAEVLDKLDVSQELNKENIYSINLKKNAYKIHSITDGGAYYDEITFYFENGILTKIVIGAGESDFSRYSQPRC